MSQSPAVKSANEDRPWGCFEILYDGPDCKVKRITVKPEQRLSLQLHHKRQEHWTIVSGEGLMTLGDEEFKCKAGDDILIPVEKKHRIANTGQQDLVFIEVQLGSYFGEDDIVRFQDDYSRS